MRILISTFNKHPVYSPHIYCWEFKLPNENITKSSSIAHAFAPWSPPLNDEVKPEMLFTILTSLTGKNAFTPTIKSALPIVYFSVKHFTQFTCGKPRKPLPPFDAWAWETRHVFIKHPAHVRVKTLMMRRRTMKSGYEKYANHFGVLRRGDERALWTVTWIRLSLSRWARHASRGGEWSGTCRGMSRTMSVNLETFRIRELECVWTKRKMLLIALHQQAKWSERKTSAAQREFMDT